MGDGICDDFNNSNLCEFDLGDCCGPNKLDGALDTCCILQYSTQFLMIMNVNCSRHQKNEIKIQCSNVQRLS